MNNLKMNNRGQLVIWVIVAAAILITIAISFLFVNKPTATAEKTGYNSKAFIEKCVNDRLSELIDSMLPHGGFVEPKLYKNYNNISIEYLCYNRGSYTPCVNQHPYYIREVSDEIKNRITPEIEYCFSELKKSLASNNMDMIDSNMNLSVILVTKIVKLKINREIVIKQGESAQTIDNWDINFNSPIFDLIQAAVDITNAEGRYCYSEYVGYMFAHPGLIIYKKALGDSSKLYQVKDVETEKMLSFFVRGCAIPPGL